MLESVEFELEKISPDKEKDEQIIMFEKAGLLLESLNFDNEEQEEDSVNITKCIMDESPSSSRNQQGSSDEDQNSDAESLADAIENMLKDKEDEIEAIKLESDILFKKLSLKDEEQLSARKNNEAMTEKVVFKNEEQISVDELKEVEHLNPGEIKSNERLVKQDDLLNEEKTIEVPENVTEKDTLINKEPIILAQKEEIIISQLDNIQIKEPNSIIDNKSPNEEKQNERELDEAEIMLDKLAFSFEEESINTMLQSVQSRQNVLQEKMEALQASADYLREQLKEEKEKWKQEIKQTVQLEKKIKSENQINNLLPQKPWAFNDNSIQQKMDMFKEYLYFTNSTMTIEKELKRRNYQIWLSEIANECDKQLTRVQSNLSVLKPLKELVSNWDKEGDMDSSLNYKNSMIKNEINENYNVNVTEKEKQKEHISILREDEENKGYYAETLEKIKEEVNNTSTIKGESKTNIYKEIVENKSKDKDTIKIEFEEGKGELKNKYEKSSEDYNKILDQVNNIELVTKIKSVKSTID